MSHFSLSIRKWYRLNKRNLPWRESSDPYIIWLSEVILQQTRVDQGIAYFNKFTTNYPTVSALALASEEQVLNDWQGLGYYSRARNLLNTARFITTELNGKFPKNFHDLIQLKGIGPYSAAAIASFAYNECQAVVDGNVYRVISRYFAIDTPIDSSKGKKKFHSIASELIDKDHPGEHNQAIMEVGALVCTPKNPSCSKCPLQSSCASFSTSSQIQYPVKSKRIAVKPRYFHYIVYNWDNKLVMKKRSDKDIWLGMYDFPLIETSGPDAPDETLDCDKISKPYTHILSHQKLHVKFYIFQSKPTAIQESWETIQMKDLEDIPLPRLIDRFLEDMN